MKNGNMILMCGLRSLMLFPNLYTAYGLHECTVFAIILAEINIFLKHMA